MEMAVPMKPGMVGGMIGKKSLNSVLIKCTDTASMVTVSRS